MELRDIDVNEPAETPVPSAETPANPVEVPVETPKEDPKPAEEPAKAPAEDPAKNGQLEGQEPKPQEPAQPKRSRAEERIRDLARENRELQEKVQKFSQQAAPELQKEEIAYDDLNKVINERAMQAAELLIASKQVSTQLKDQAEKWADDLDQVKKDNPQLDPDSPDYDPVLDSTLARLMDDGTGNGTPRTDILVSDVLKVIKGRETAVQQKAKEEGKSEATAKLAKQMAEGAITPGAKAPSEAEEYTDEDLAEMRVKDPKKYMKIIDQI